MNVHNISPRKYIKQLEKIEKGLRSLEAYLKQHKSKHATQEIMQQYTQDQSAQTDLVLNRAGFIFAGALVCGIILFRVQR